MPKFSSLKKTLEPHCNGNKWVGQSIILTRADKATWIKLKNHCTGPIRAFVEEALRVGSINLLIKIEEEKLIKVCFVNARQKTLLSGDLFCQDKDIAIEIDNPMDLKAIDLYKNE